MNSDTIKGNLGVVLSPRLQLCWVDPLVKCTA